MTLPQPHTPPYYAATPGRLTLFLRTFLPWQAWRFAWINLKMLRMIAIGHHGRAPLRPSLLEANAPPAPDGPPR